MTRTRILAGIFIIILVVVLIALFHKDSGIEIKNGKIQKKPVVVLSSLAGLPCENPTRRPWAVMMPSDPETRPLAGIGQADMVFEMPVTESGVTRMMAVFQCTYPSEVGSIRSAREDFLPLALGLNAILMHWGGEHNALDKLDRGIINNIDCLKLDGSTCLRKKNIPMPHNGYSTADLFLKKATALGYKLEAIINYEHGENKSQGIIAPPKLYAGANSVVWSYDPATNLYSRARNGKQEIDRGTNVQVTASNVVVLNTTSTYVSVLYNRVKTVGSGSATVYQNGVAIPAKWQKTSDTNKLMFLDTADKEISFVPGSTWIQVATQ